MQSPEPDTALAPPAKPFEWPGKSVEAAQMVAEDKLTDVKIAQTLQIARSTLSLWKTHPEFAAEVAQRRAAFAEAVRSRGIAVVENRVDWLNERAQLMRQVIAERAKDPDMAKIPGGKTGLVVRQVKGIGRGEDFQLVETYEVDTGLLAEMRNHEKQAAQELGQWEDKSRVNVNIPELSDEQLERLAAGKSAGGT